MTPCPSDERPLDAEIESALADINLQEVDLPPSKSGGAAGRPAQGAKGGAGERLMPGQIVEVRADDVFVELGPRMQGFLPAAEFDEPPTVGETMNFLLRGREEDNLWRLSLRGAKELAAWNELEPGSHVKARVTGQNTGGLELAIGPGKAFMPASQVALQRVEDLSSMLGETFVTKVIEVDKSRKRVVLSRRAILEAELHEARAQASEHLQVGQTIRGKVTRIESFGAFIDLGGGLEGLAHVSNLSRQRVEKAEDVVALGQEVEAMVLDIKEGGRRIGLGMKQLEPDPWDHLPPGVSEESVMQGKVTRIAEFGAFVELSPGIEGLCHVSQLGLGGGRRRTEEAVSVGQEISVRIVSIEPDRQRISLSTLDRRGAKIGSDEAVDEGMLREAMDQQQKPLGTNLGSLFKKALDQ
ncbi:MAG: S1 RNA-binding domain-containing protein [Planctomycetota bacterium]